MLRARGPLARAPAGACCEDFGDTVDRLGGAYITAEDVGTSAADMEVIAERTPHVARARARARRLGRPEPVHRARRRDGDRGVLRARLRHARRSPAARWRWPGSGTSAATSRAGSRRPARRSSWPTSTRASGRSPTSSAPAGSRPRTRSRGGRRLRAVRARRGAQRRHGARDALRDHRRRGEQPARRRPHRRPPQRPRDPVGARLRRERRRDREHRRRVRAGRLRPAARARPACAGSATRCGAVFDDAERMSATPLTAAMELARRNLEQAGGRCRRPARIRAGQPAVAAALRRAQPVRQPRPLDPSGSRPSPASFSRCAPSVAAAAIRRAGGASSHAASRISSTLRAPASSASSSRRSRSRRWATYSSSFAAGSSTSGPWPGHRSARSRSREGAERVEVLAELPDDEHRALAEDGVAGERDVPVTNARWSGVWPGVATASERPGALARRDPVPRAAPGLLGHRRGGLGVVGVPVGEDDPGGAAAPLGLGHHGRDVVVEAWTGVDDPARVAADQPRVRAGQRERPRVRRPDQRDVVGLERHSWVRW